MALGEGPALRVLPREADGGAVLEQRGEGQGFGVRPVYGVEISAVLLEEALELGVRREAFGDLEQGLVQFGEPLGRDGGLGDPDERRVQLIRGEVFFLSSSVGLFWTSAISAMISSK